MAGHARAMRSRSAGTGATSPMRGHDAVSPALHQGVAVAMAGSRAAQAMSCAAQPGNGTASLASSSTSASAQAFSMSSRCAASPMGRGRRV